VIAAFEAAARAYLDSPERAAFLAAMASARGARKGRTP